MTSQDIPAPNRPAMSVLRMTVLATLLVGVVLGVVFLGDRLSQFLDWAGGLGLFVLYTSGSGGDYHCSNPHRSNRTRRSGPGHRKGFTTSKNRM